MAQGGGPGPQPQFGGLMGGMQMPRPNGGLGQPQQGGLGQYLGGLMGGARPQANPPPQAQQPGGMAMAGALRNFQPQANSWGQGSFSQNPQSGQWSPLQQGLAQGAGAAVGGVARPAPSPSPAPAPQQSSIGQSVQPLQPQNQAMQQKMGNQMPIFTANRGAGEAY